MTNPDQTKPDTSALDAIEWPDNDYEPRISHTMIYDFCSSLPTIIVQAMTLLRHHPKYSSYDEDDNIREEAEWKANCDTIIADCQYYLDHMNEAQFDTEAFVAIQARIKNAFDILAPMLYHCWT